MNVLLSKEYQGQKAGKLLTDLTVGEARAIENLDLGQILKDEKPAEDEKPAGRKPEKPAAE